MRGWENVTEEDLARLRAGPRDPSRAPARADLLGERVAESSHQRALFRVIEAATPAYPELARTFHVPNGGHRVAAVAGQLRAEGVRPYVPDVVHPSPRAGFASLAIELKAEDGSLRRGQRDYLAGLGEDGWLPVAARGWEPAWRVLAWYVRQPRTVTLRPPGPVYFAGWHRPTGPDVEALIQDTRARRD